MTRLSSTAWLSLALVTCSLGVASATDLLPNASAQEAEEAKPKRPPSGAANVAHPNKVRVQNNAKIMREKRKTAAERRAKLKAQRAEREQAKAKKTDKEEKEEKEEKKTEKAGKEQDKAPKPKTTPKKPKVIVYKDVPLTPLEQRLSETLALELDAGGPYEPWRVTVRNVGAQPVRVFKDVRLLWFEANVPGKRKPTYCKLPDSMLPKVARDRSRTALEPGQGFSFQVDPRFYCFESTDTSILVPGAFVRAHYGWQTNGRFVWDKGKLRRLRLTQKAPYVAKPSAETADGLKDLESTGVALGNEYIDWSKTRIKGVDVRPHDAALSLSIDQGADVDRGNTAWVEVSVKNHSRETQTVFLRRELLSFSVRGPTGRHECEPEESYRSPDEMNMQRLAPGKDVSMTVRLAEFCDAEVFSAPGLYYVTARLPLPDDDSERDDSATEEGEIPDVEDEIGAAHEHPGPDDAGDEHDSANTEHERSPRALRAKTPRLIRVRQGTSRFVYEKARSAAMSGERRDRR